MKRTEKKGGKEQSVLPLSPPSLLPLFLSLHGLLDPQLDRVSLFDVPGLPGCHLGDQGQLLVALMMFNTFFCFRVFFGRGSRSNDERCSVFSLSSFSLFSPSLLFSKPQYAPASTALRAGSRACPRPRCRSRPSRRRRDFFCFCFFRRKKRSRSRSMMSEGD